jgi:adenylate cyclase
MAVAMAMEIERKFLVVSDEWRTSVSYYRRLRQGYLTKTANGSVRVRRSAASATITVKGPRNGIMREEFEYDIPVEEADVMLRTLCARPLVEKVRYWVEHAGMTWEIDVYSGAAAGLVLAEIELDQADQAFAVPRWVGAEVTHDARYSSAAIAARLAPPIDGVRARPRRQSFDRNKGDLGAGDLGAGA